MNLGTEHDGGEDEEEESLETQQDQQDHRGWGGKTAALWKKKGGKAERNVGGWGWCNNRSVRQGIMEGWREGTGMEE